MCECGKTAMRATSASRTREIIARLFAAGNAKAAFAHRLAQCCHGSDCGRLCPNLVKAPGVAAVYCVNLDDGTKRELYSALEDADFACPRSLF